MTAGKGERGMNRPLMLVLLVLAPLILVGCYEDTTPTRYEPGVYKGEADPLLDELASEDLRTRLNDRFERVAADR